MLPLLLALLFLLPPAVDAQGLPAFAPINPVATSRSGLGFEPYREPASGRWLLGVGVDYASTIEYNDLVNGDYYLDSELLRISLRAGRDLDRTTFLLADADVRGAYDGFLDGFLDWYHGLLGLDIPERDRRPKDEFLYEVSPAGLALEPEASPLFLGDIRVGIGRRWTPQLQSIAAVTLPTATGPGGYGRGVPSVSLLNTVHAAVNPRLTYEGSLSLGYTPRHGALERWQRAWMVSGSSGLRMGIWGRQSLFANLFYHAPYYAGTLLPALDRRELSLDFGWILDRGQGSEWRVGMTEDLEPGGPAIDLVFRLGASF